MAKILAEFDTLAKTLVVKIDDEIVDDVKSVAFYEYGYEDDKFYASINTGESMEDEGMYKSTTIYGQELRLSAVSEQGKDVIEKETKPVQTVAENLAKILFNRN